MKILIIGIDGYLGWPTAVNLSHNHDVFGIDNFSKRKIELELNIRPLNHLPTMLEKEYLYVQKDMKLYLDLLPIIL